MNRFDRLTLIEDCREACRTNVLRTAEESREVRERAEEACCRLGIESPEDADKVLA